MVKWHKVISTVVAVVFAMSGNLVMTVATAAPVATVKLSSLQQIEEKLDNGLALSIAMANLSNDEAKLVLAQQRSGAKLFGTITYGANNEPLTDTSTQMHSYNKLSFTGRNRQRHWLTLLIVNGNFNLWNISRMYVASNNR